MEATKRPWTQGRTLVTPQTKQWNSTQWAANELEEKRRIFASFLSEDQGRSRMLVATCETEEDAAYIVRAVNTFDQARELLDAIQVICDDPQTSYHIPGTLMDRLIRLQADMEVP